MSPEDVQAGAEELPLTGDYDFALRITVALVLGLVVGIEREYHGHPAGMRTMALVCVGACMFTALGLEPAFGTRVDPTRIAAQIVTGVGFLGAGAILRQGGAVIGMTTAATIWVAASLGMAIGFGYFALGIFSVVLVVATLTALRPLERRLFREQRNRRHGDPPQPEEQR